MFGQGLECTGPALISGSHILVLQHLPFSSNGCCPVICLMQMHVKLKSQKHSSKLQEALGLCSIFFFFHYCSITVENDFTLLVADVPFFLDVNLMKATLHSRFQCRYSQQHATSSYYVFHTANGILSHDNPLALWRCCQSDIMLAAGISTVFTGGRKTWKLARFQRTDGNETSTSLC